MNIVNLQSTQATLNKSSNSTYNMKIDKEKIKKDFAQIKSEGKLKDLVSLSDNGKASISDLKVGESVKILCNYSSDVFFNKDLPKETDADGNYEIGGVKFTADELKEARRVMQTAVNGCGVGIGKNLNIDYINYAQMTLAENAVNKYAKENLSEEQQKVVSNAMKNYNSAVEKMQKDYLSENEHIKNDYGELSNYYSLSKTLTQNEADALNQLKSELSKVTGKKYPLSKAGEASGIVQVATNEDLITNIKNLFSDVDLNDKAAVNSAMDKYKELMTAAYKADGSKDRDVNNRLNSDASKLMNFINNLNSIKNYTEVNYSI